MSLLCRHSAPSLQKDRSHPQPFMNGSSVPASPSLLTDEYVSLTISRLILFFLFLSYLSLTFSQRRFFYCSIVASRKSVGLTFMMPSDISCADTHRRSEIQTSTVVVFFFLWALFEAHPSPPDSSPLFFAFNWLTHTSCQQSVVLASLCLKQP